MRITRLFSVLAATCLAGCALSWRTAPAHAQPATPPASEQSPSAKMIYGFRCYKFNDAYVIGLGDIDKPSGNVARRLEAQPLEGSGSHIVAAVISSSKGYSVESRCSTIAARMTNLALANNSATALGILELTSRLVPGEMEGRQVIAIDKVTPENVLATVGNGMTAQQALKTIDTRIRRVATKQVLTDSLKDADIIIFEISLK